MSLKSLIAPYVADYILSEKRLQKKRIRFEDGRKKQDAAHIIEFFHDPGDPYSQLLEKVIPEIAARYAVKIETHLVPPPTMEATPEAECLKAFSRSDVQLLAAKAGIEFEFEESQADGDTSKGDERRTELGHYLGATLHYAGEWYWGLDRLHYLEKRLVELNLERDNVAEPIFSPPEVPSTTSPNKLAENTTIHFYFSFRSPYSAISAGRIAALAKAYGAELKPRFVLPMVMRGLPVPKNKSNYIIHDTAREARRLGIPFGKVCDPLGKPVERGYSLLAWCREQGKEFDFIKNYLEMVWSQGVDAGSDRGMRKIVEAAGLPWAQAKSILGNEDWKQEAEDNRLEMMDYQIWGVPSFRVGDVITWGQDRLWVIEDELKRLARSQ